MKFYALILYFMFIEKTPYIFYIEYINDGILKIPNSKLIMKVAN